MTEYANQSLSHAIVAALVVELLLRVWRIAEPTPRLAFRLLPLAYPLAVLPAFLILVPVRGSEAFRDEWALFAASRWTAVGVPGVRVGSLVFAILAALGAGLFLRDALRLLRRRADADERSVAARSEPGDVLAREVGALAGRLGVGAPPLRVIDTAVPVLQVAGIRRPLLVVSRGALGRLDARERRAALAHELAHLARRDPLLGWLLMGCRLVAFFNPAVQLAARAAVRELEWRADDLAASATADRDALASGLAKLGGAGATRDAPRHRLAALVGGLRARGEAEAICARRRRLLEPPAGPATTFTGLRVALTGSALALLLFFVV